MFLQYIIVLVVDHQNILLLCFDICKLTFLLILSNFDLFCNDKLSSLNEIHFRNILITLHYKSVFISWPKLSGLKSKRDVIEKIRIHCFTVIKKISKLFLLKYILIEVLSHQFSLYVSWQGIEIIFLF
jgi:hypothetical protein